MPDSRGPSHAYPAIQAPGALQHQPLVVTFPSSEAPPDKRRQSASVKKLKPERYHLKFFYYPHTIFFFSVATPASSFYNFSQTSENQSLVFPDTFASRTQDVRGSQGIFAANKPKK